MDVCNIAPPSGRWSTVPGLCLGEPGLDSPMNLRRTQRLYSANAPVPVLRRSVGHHGARGRVKGCAVKDGGGLPFRDS